MNKCVFTVLDKTAARNILTVCGAAGEYMFNGSSFCSNHIALAIKGTTSQNQQ